MGISWILDIRAESNPNQNETFHVPVPCAGVHYIGKRGADSDAGFYHYGAYPSFYYGGHAGYPFAGHLIGKREADSDAGFYHYGAYPSYYYGGYAGHPYGVLLG